MLAALKAVALTLVTLVFCGCVSEQESFYRPSVGRSETLVLGGCGGVRYAYRGPVGAGVVAQATAFRSINNGLAVTVTFDGPDSALSLVSQGQILLVDPYGAQPDQVFHTRRTELDTSIRKGTSAGFETTYPADRPFVLALPPEGRLIRFEPVVERLTKPLLCP